MTSQYQCSLSKDVLHVGQACLLEGDIVAYAVSTSDLCPTFSGSFPEAEDAINILDFNSLSSSSYLVQHQGMRGCIESFFFIALKSIHANKCVWIEY